LTTQRCDLLVIGGGIHGAAIARDAAGRGLKVMLAEKGDYASATSGASSKLIHGGLRYLEHFELGLVRESLLERGQLLKTAPHLVAPLRFLLPLYRWQRRPALMVQAGLALYDLLAIGSGLPRGGRLSQREIGMFPRLVQRDLTAVLHYWDAQTDDARLTLAVLLDARTRGADVRNRRAVTALTPIENGYAAKLDERRSRRRIEARFVVNASGPWIAEVDALSSIHPPSRPLKLVRGSHIVLPMPEPTDPNAYTLQDEEDRVIFVLPWLDQRFLIVGTTDVPHVGDPCKAVCSADEQAYLLGAYNRYFARVGRPAAAADVAYTWSGVRALADDDEIKPERLSRSPALAQVANGAGGMVSLYGGKLTTHRVMAEDVLGALRDLGCAVGAPWTKEVPLHGGHLARDELLARAAQGPASVPLPVRRRWTFTYGDQIEALYARLARDPAAAHEIAPGVALAELEHAVEVEDAATAEDFLLRRTKLHLLLDRAGREAITDWFGRER
jgi:glycerol-3-phosphate dehydrogenase